MFFNNTILRDRDTGAGFSQFQLLFVSNCGREISWDSGRQVGYILVSNKQIHTKDHKDNYSFQFLRNESQMFRITIKLK